MELKIMIITNKMKIFFYFFAKKVEKLYQKDIITIDGTFSVVSSPYYQMVTISFIKEHSVCPVFIQFLRTKNYRLL